MNGRTDSYNFLRVSPDPLEKHAQEWKELESEYQSMLDQIEDLLEKTDDHGMPISCGVDKVDAMNEKTLEFYNKMANFVAKLSGVCDPDPECEEDLKDVKT